MSLLVDWKVQDFASLEKRVLVARHALAQASLFSDEGLAKILDEHPDCALTLSTMGEDSKTFEWRDGDRNGVGGARLLETVRRGQLWINCPEILKYQPELAKLVNDLYAELEAGSRHFRAEDRSANLLISSIKPTISCGIGSGLSPVECEALGRRWLPIELNATVDHPQRSATRRPFYRLPRDNQP